MSETTFLPSRVLLVDDNQQFLAFSREFLSEFADIEVAGLALTAQEAMRLALEARPHIVVADLAMPGTNGLELTHQIKAALPGVPVIILTLQDSAHYRHAALEAGADAFVPKAAMDTELVPAIRRLAATRPN